jgi:tripartite ATP-independent transporter DctP family solute receptor
MMLKKFRCLALVMVLILVGVSCTTFAAKKPIKLTYGSIMGTQNYFHKGDLMFKKLVEKKSKGQILVDLYCDGELGSVSEQIQAVKTGAQHIMLNAIGEFIPFYKKLGTFDLPYIYRDIKHVSKVAEKFTSLIDQNDLVARTGMRLVAAWIRTPRQLNTKFPVKKLEDIKGIKLRVPQQPVSVALWKALGTVPTVIPGSDIYTSLATGVVDAQENSLDAIFLAKFYEQAKYCALTSHLQETTLNLISNDFWNGLTSKQKKIIQDAMNKTNKQLIKTALEKTDEYYKSLVKLGMIFTKPDLAPFREKGKTIWKEFGDRDLIKKIQAIK